MEGIGSGLAKAVIPGADSRGSCNLWNLPSGSQSRL